MVKANAVEKFIRLGGYDIVKRKRGKWKNISEASRKTGLSRPTIYAILAEYPEPPSKTKPKYVAEYEASEAYRLIKEKYEKKLSRGEYQNTQSTIRKAWLRLGKPCDPASWGREHYTKIWNMDEYIDPLAGGVESHVSTKFHRLMRVTRNLELIAEFEGKARPLGRKKHWFLGDNDLIKLAGAFEQKDVLLFTFGGVVWGARSSAMLRLKVEDINFEDLSITMYEPKVKKTVSKFPPPCLFDMLKQYIKEKQLKPTDNIFPNQYDYYNKAMKAAGEKAGLGKVVTTHILKHTFVSQGHRHGLSRETVVEQTGTQDRTIKASYLSVDEKRLRHEMQGAKLDVIPFHQWVKDIIYPHFNNRFQQLKF